MKQGILLFIVTTLFFGCATMEKRLFEYSAAGDVARIQDLKHKGVDLNTINSLGETPLHIAVWENNLELSQMLITEGADIEPVDLKGQTPLIAATYNENIPIVELLLLNGARSGHHLPHFYIAHQEKRSDGKYNVIVAKGDNGLTPLLFAISANNFELFNKILEYTDDIDYSFSTNDYVRGYDIGEMYRYSNMINRDLLRRSANVTLNNYNMHLSDGNVEFVVASEPTVTMKPTPLTWSIMQKTKDYRILEALATRSSRELNKKAMRMAEQMNDDRAISILENYGY